MHSAQARELLWVFATFEIKKSYISQAERVTHLNGFYWINSPLVSTWVSSLELNQQWLSVQYFIVTGIGAKCAWIPPAGSREGRCCQQTDGKHGCWWGLWAQPGQQLLRGWEFPCERSARKTLHPRWDAFTFPLVSKATELFPFIAPPFLIAVLRLNQTSFSCPCMQLKVNVFWMTWGRDHFTGYLILIQH